MTRNVLTIGIVLLAAACARDPAAGLVFACDPDWQAQGVADPCRAGCRCERAPVGWSHDGVCACGAEGFDFGAGGSDATDDVPAGDDGDLPPGPDTLDAPDDTADVTPVDVPDETGTTDDPGFGELPDVCIPDCPGMECGQDGCGGTCGTCGDNETCVSGLCRPLCWPTGHCPGGLQKHDGCRCRVLPTGATKCMTDQGLVACETIPYGEDYFGQDAHLTFDVHAFWGVGDGVVTDQNTGLVWSQTVHPDGAFEAAISLCANQPSGAGLPAWRLPTVWELLSVVDFGRACPMWDPLFGTACEAGMAFWTSNTVDDDSNPVTPDLPLIVDVGYGFARPSPYEVSNKSRCVRGDEVLMPVDSDRFVHGFSTVTDRLTGLEWQAKAEFGTSDWKSALAKCNALGVGWHLPTLTELASLMPFSQGACPSWGGTPVPGTNCGALPTMFWTSTPMPDQELSVFTIDFQTVSISGSLISTKSRATRCVRSNG